MIRTLKLKALIIILEIGLEVVDQIIVEKCTL